MDVGIYVIIRKKLYKIVVFVYILKYWMEVMELKVLL